MTQETLQRANALDKQIKELDSILAGQNRKNQWRKVTIHADRCEDSGSVSPAIMEKIYATIQIERDALAAELEKL